MKAIVLAGGFARRLRPLSDETPKPLLKIAGRPMIDFIIDKIIELNVDQIIVSTNLKFKANFEKWLSSKTNLNATIVWEPSLREEEKPGAAAALAQISPMVEDDNCLIIAGDNLFTASLAPLAKFFDEKKSPVIGVYDVKQQELAREYSNVVLDSQLRIVDFVEKPSNPASTLIGTCIYFLPEKTIPRLREFNLAKGNHDSPGRFIQWLHQVEPVYGMKLPGLWWDIGSLDQYEAVNELMRRVEEPIPS